MIYMNTFEALTGAIFLGNQRLRDWMSQSVCVREGMEWEVKAEWNEVHKVQMLLITDRLLEKI